MWGSVWGLELDVEWSCGVIDVTAVVGPRRRKNKKKEKGLRRVWWFVVVAL